MEKQLGLPRAVMLKKRRLFRALYDKGNAQVQSVAVGCVRAVFMIAPKSLGEITSHRPFQVGFSAGRGMKRAVDRNRVKRILREQFRLHQELLSLETLPKERCLYMMILYRAKPDEATKRIPHDLPKLLTLINERMKK